MPAGDDPRAQIPPQEPAGIDPAASGPARRSLRAAFTRYVLLGCGIVLLTIGAIGMVVPMMPGTIFLILAAWCFARSSPRFEAWLLANRYLGPSVARWRDTGAIPLPVKLLALTSFVGSFTAAWYAGAPTLALIGLGALFLVLAIFMVTRPNR